MKINYQPAGEGKSVGRGVAIEGGGGDDGDEGVGEALALLEAGEGRGVADAERYQRLVLRRADHRQQLRHHSPYRRLALRQDRVASGRRGRHGAVRLLGGSPIDVGIGCNSFLRKLLA